MHAIVRSTYGPPDVLKSEEVETPTPRDDEVRIQVMAASVNAADRYLLRGRPVLVRLMTGGFLWPRLHTLGADVAGRIDAVGAAVTKWKPGDAVIADLSAHGFGGFAEFVCVPETALAPKPERLSFVEAAALPVAGTAALQGLRDVGRIQSGHRVLVNGASGGVGSLAVQIATTFGAHVTGTCRTSKMRMVRALGADRVLDYTQTDVTRESDRYDLILDTGAHRAVGRYRRILRPRGTYVLVGGAVRHLVETLIVGGWQSLTGGSRMEVLMSASTPEDLATLGALVDSGAVTPVVDRTFPLADVPRALRYVESGRVRGKVVIGVVPAAGERQEKSAPSSARRPHPPLRRRR
jgi:NADPH:quinone reductase-like Zn-dependent oxidoreductase